MFTFEKSSFVIIFWIWYFLYSIDESKLIVCITSKIIVRIFNDGINNNLKKFYRTLITFTIDSCMILFSFKQQLSSNIFMARHLLQLLLLVMRWGDYKIPFPSPVGHPVFREVFRVWLLNLLKHGINVSNGWCCKLQFYCNKWRLLLKSDFNNLYILFHDAYRFVVIMISVHFKINDKSNLMTIILPSRS